MTRPNIRGKSFVTLGPNVFAPNVHACEGLVVIACWMLIRNFFVQ
jgi:hypothetical protein